MKKNILLLFIVCLPLWAKAEKVQIDGIWYNLVEKALNTAEVTYADNYKYSDDVFIPSAIKYNGQTYEVTAIGEDAFYKCKNLKSINLPNSIKKLVVGLFPEQEYLL